MPAAETAGLIDTLRDAGLLTPAQAEELAGVPLDAPALSAELLRRGWVTRFQAGRIADGRAAELTLGPYLLVDRLGAGGMGEVFKARHTLMNRVVALKVVRDERLGGEGTAARFRREIEAAGRLSHPNIVIAHDAAHVRGVHFYVMEYVPGTDLSRLVKETGPLPVGLACEVARQAALGLQHAHEKGLVHRDVKPSNLMLIPGPPPVVKVLDVGLARLADAGPAGELTADGVVMGTPDYLAPEQGEDAHAVDIRADVYSLGCTLYHLLAGRPPFPRGSFAQKIIKHREIDPAPLDAVRPEVPRTLAGMVQKMMAKRPADRYQTPAEVAAAVAPFADAAGPAPAVRPAPEAAPAADTHGGGGALVGTSVSDAGPPIIEPIADVWSGLDADAAGPHHRAADAAPLARRGRGPLVAAAAVLVLLLGLGGLYSTTVIRLVTNKGELTVEVDDPTVEVIVYQGSAKVVDKTKDRTFVLTAGEDGRVEFLDPDTGARALTREFRIERGGKVLVRGTVREIAASRKAGPGPKKAGADPAREAVDWVLSKGGGVTVGGKAVTAAKDLPPGPVRPTAVNLSGRTTAQNGVAERLASADELAVLRGLPDTVRLLDLRGQPVTAAALGALADAPWAPKLEKLYLQGPELTDDVFRQAARFPGLRLLSVKVAPKVDGSGLKDLAGLPNLTELNLDVLTFRPGALAGLTGLRLKELDLWGSRGIDDDALATIAKITTLESLTLKGSPVTGAGLKHLGDLKELTALNLADTRADDAGLAALAGLPKLHELGLQGSKVTDHGLDELARFPALAKVSLQKTAVTEAGLKKLAAARPDCRIEADGGTIGPTRKD